MRTSFLCVQSTLYRQKEVKELNEIVCLFVNGEKYHVHFLACRIESTTSIAAFGIFVPGPNIAFAPACLRKS
jgi:hypothetical protein